MMSCAGAPNTIRQRRAISRAAGLFFSRGDGTSAKVVAVRKARFHAVRRSSGDIHGRNTPPVRPQHCCMADSKPSEKWVHGAARKVKCPSSVARKRTYNDETHGRMNSISRLSVIGNVRARRPWPACRDCRRPAMTIARRERLGRTGASQYRNSRSVDTAANFQHKSQSKEDK